MRLEYSLPQLEANRVSQLAWKKLPYLRHVYFGLTFPLTISASAAAYILNDGFSGIVMAASMWLFIPVLTWYILTVKHSAFSDATAGSFVSGSTVSYSYEISDIALVWSVDGIEQQFLLSDILEHRLKNGELRVRTQPAMVTIPAGSVSPEKLVAFSNALSEAVNGQ